MTKWWRPFKGSRCTCKAPDAALSASMIPARSRMPVSKSPSTEIQGYAMGNGVVRGLLGSIAGPSMIVFFTLAFGCFMFSSPLFYTAFLGQSSLTSLPTASATSCRTRRPFFFTPCLSPDTICDTKGSVTSTCRAIATRFTSWRVSNALM